MHDDSKLAVSVRKEAAEEEEGGGTELTNGGEMIWHGHFVDHR